MSIAKRIRWIEDDVLSLPSGEHDYFDRKSGALLTDSEFQKKLAKALSAFANSGGGHLLLGVKDDGTFDGVPEIHKGRQSTREWVEQVAPNLVSYPLQDIRVHQVEPSIPSAIPSGKVVIVIDVGDSNLAPHQSIFAHIYYHRVGGHSTPAPHFYLETLRGRERYPSREVARKWRDDVLTPLINTLKREMEYLESETWTWGARRESLPELIVLSSSHALTENHKEFFEFYPDVKQGMLEHDNLYVAVYKYCSDLYKSVFQSDKLLEVYQRAISPGELQRLRDSSRTLAVYSADETLLGELFGSKNSTEENLKSLAQFIVNRGINYNSTISPLWEFHKDEFLQVLSDPSVKDADDTANTARDKLLRFVAQFISQVKTVRTSLARQHGIPVE